MKRMRASALAAVLVGFSGAMPAFADSSVSNADVTQGPVQCSKEDLASTVAGVVVADAGLQWPNHDENTDEFGGAKWAKSLVTGYVEQDVLLLSPQKLEALCQAFTNQAGLDKMRSESKGYVHHSITLPVAALFLSPVNQPHTSTANKPGNQLEPKIGELVGDLADKALALFPAPRSKGSVAGQRTGRVLQRDTNAVSSWKKKGPGEVAVGPAGNETPAAAVTSLADTTSYLMVPSQDAGDMYLEGAEKEKVCWPPTEEGGGCRQLALKVVSSVGAGQQADVGKVQGNYVAIVDYTDPNDIFQQTFPLVSGDHDFYLDNRDSKHLKYHFKISIDQDGGITLSRVDTKPLVKKKGFFGGIENFFGGLLHGQTATPVAYTSAAQLYLDRNDEIQSKPVAQITLGGQKFSIISQGGPHGCLLFFAVGSGGSLLAGPNGGAPGYKPNMMACVNHVAGDGTSEMIGGPQCLGTYPSSGDRARAYSIEWEPQSSTVGTDFKIVPLATPQTGACQPPKPKGDDTKPDDKKPDGPQPPTQPTNGKCAPGTEPQAGSDKCCPSGTKLQGDSCVPSGSSQNECNYNLDGKDASGNDKMKVGNMDDGYALYVGPQTLKLQSGYAAKTYQSYICSGGSLVQVPGIVYGGLQSAGNEIGVSAYGVQYDGGVSPQDFADITVSASNNDKADKHIPEKFINLKSGQSLEFSQYMPAEQIYNFPAGDFGSGAPQKALLAQDAANSVETVDPASDDVNELDVYPRGSDAAAAVKSAIDNHLQKADQEKVGALQQDENGILEKELSRLPGNAVIEIHLQGGQTASGATGCSPAVGASYSDGGKQVDKTLVDYEFAHASSGQSVTLVPFMARCEPK